MIIYYYYYYYILSSISETFSFDSSTVCWMIFFPILIVRGKTFKIYMKIIDLV